MTRTLKIPVAEFSAEVGEGMPSTEIDKFLTYLLDYNPTGKMVYKVKGRFVYITYETFDGR